jgi:hypothetical protein
MRIDFVVPVAKATIVLDLLSYVDRVLPAGIAARHSKFYMEVNGKGFTASVGAITELGR